MSTPAPASAAAPDDSPFWHFSLALYGRPDVPEACLRLQDECRADVNVMLYLLFLARSGRRIDTPDIARIEALASTWRDEIVRPLRAVRRSLKSPPEHFRDDATQALRTAVKRIELEAERLQQRALERHLPAHVLGTPAPAPDCAAHNLQAYAKRLGGFPDEPVAVLLRRLDDT
jgi:uncharacterized protein (TIGR02444 family)